MSFIDLLSHWRHCHRLLFFKHNAALAAYINGRVVCERQTYLLAYRR